MSENKELDNHEFKELNLDSKSPENNLNKKNNEQYNEAFEHDDSNMTSDFNRNRPGSTISVRTNASTTSRSSVNCSTGSLRCPNLRLTKFFSYKEGNLDKCMADIKPILIEEIDGKILGYWLLIEIDHWDLQREKVVILNEKTLVVTSYNFIKNHVRYFKRLSLAAIKSVNYGNLTYPQSSMMGKYLYGAIKITWGDDPGFFQRWNPLSDSIPFLIFTSHHIIYNEKERETTIYNCDDFIGSLEQALSKIPMSKPIDFTESPIEITSYASLVSVLYNQNWLGFQLDRNGMNF